MARSNLNSLSDLQQAVLLAVTGQERGPALSAIFARDGDDADKRLNVYERAYQLRLQECLQGDFPVVAKILGPKQWSQVVQEYIQAHPPSGATLAGVGRGLPHWMAQSGLLQSYGYLADLAKLEWCMVECAYTPGEDPLTPQQLMESLSEDAAPLCRLRLGRGTRVVASLWPLTDIYEAENSFSAQSSLTVVYRHEGQVSYQGVSKEQALLLEMITSDWTLGEITQRWTEDDLLDQAGVLESSLFDWIRLGIVRPA